MASPFIWASGTSGWTTTPFNLLSTELNSLANGNTALSSVGGSSGVFDQSNTGGALWGIVSFIAGGAVTPAAPNYIAGWFNTKADNSAYEKTVSNATQQRTPDFVVPLIAAAYASSDVSMSNGLVRIPAVPFKVIIWSQVGATLPASGNLIKLGMVEVQV